MNITKSSSSMRAKPSHLSNLETECLYGEKVVVLDNYLDWCYCKLLTDNYCGWVEKKI